MFSQFVIALLHSRFVVSYATNEDLVSSHNERSKTGTWETCERLTVGATLW